MAELGFAVAHHDDGPRVRYGALWFAAAVGSALAHRTLLALVMAVAGALAADEVVRIHDRRGRSRSPSALVAHPHRLGAALLGAALPLAAAAGSDTMVAAATAGLVLLLAIGLGGGLQDAVPPLLAALPLGLAAAAPVLVAGLGTAAAVALLVLVAAYDAGDFVVGTGAGTSWEGPAAGVAAVAVFGFAFVAWPWPPLEEDGAAALTVLVALLAPLGPPTANVLVGDGARRARFVRRLDSLLVAGPVAAYALAALLPRLAEQ